MVDFQDIKGNLEGLAEKAKDVVTDERIEAVAEKVKSIAPDSIDAKIDSVADKAKELNN